MAEQFDVNRSKVKIIGDGNVKIVLVHIFRRNKQLYSSITRQKVTKAKKQTL